MIASIEGVLAVKKDTQVIIHTSGGVGYVVYVSAETQRMLPSVGNSVKLSTFLYLRQDALELYGFLSEQELELFKLLNTVSGIGPKAAMNILGSSTTQKLRQAIAAGDEQALTRVSGIGKKMAAKVIMELKDKVRETVGSTDNAEFVRDAEVFEALRALGYGERQIQEALRSMPDDAKRAEDRVKQALKFLGRK